MLITWCSHVEKLKYKCCRRKYSKEIPVYVCPLLMIWSRHALLAIVGDRMLDFFVFPGTDVPMLFRDFELRGRGERKFSAIPLFNGRFKSLERSWLVW